MVLVVGTGLVALVVLVVGDVVPVVDWVALEVVGGNSVGVVGSEHIPHANGQ